MAASWKFVAMPLNGSVIEVRERMAQGIREKILVPACDMVLLESEDLLFAI